MSEGDVIIENCGGRTFLVKLLKEYYEKEAVFAAADMFKDKFYIKIDAIDPHVGVWFSKKQKDVDDEDVRHALMEFCNEAIDQQTKRDLQKQYGALRETIYRYAFDPIS